LEAAGEVSGSACSGIASGVGYSELVDHSSDLAEYDQHFPQYAQQAGCPGTRIPRSACGFGHFQQSAEEPIVIAPPEQKAK